jgi:hypothetical protein
MAPRAIAALRERGSGARARAVSDQLRKVAYGAPSNCCPAGSRLGCPGKSGERPAAQGREMAPRAIAALRDRGSGARARAVRPAAQGRPLAPRAIAALTGTQLGSQGKSGVRPAAQGREMAPRAIAALQDRGSGARARAVSDQLRKGRPKIEKSFID